MNKRIRRVDEEKCRPGFALIPRPDCEEFVSAELSAAITDGRHQQAHVGLPAEVPRVPEPGVAARYASSFEHALDPRRLPLDLDDPGHLGSTVDDAGDVRCGDDR